jgi:hypothetical protein
MADPVAPRAGSGCELDRWRREAGPGDCAVGRAVVVKRRCLAGRRLEAPPRIQPAARGVGISARRLARDDVPARPAGWRRSHMCARRARRCCCSVSGRRTSPGSVRCGTSSSGATSQVAARDSTRREPPTPPTASQTHPDRSQTRHLRAGRQLREWTGLRRAACVTRRRLRSRRRRHTPGHAACAGERDHGGRELRPQPRARWPQTTPAPRDPTTPGLYRGSSGDREGAAGCRRPCSTGPGPARSCPVRAAARSGQWRARARPQGTARSCLGLHAVRPVVT